MTKAEIIVNISEKTGVEKIVVASIVEGFMSEVKSNVIDNKSIFLRGFGTFKPKKRARKIGRNIKKNVAVIIPEHFIPSFKPAKSFVEKVKNR